MPRKRMTTERFFVFARHVVARCRGFAAHSSRNRKNPLVPRVHISMSISFAQGAFIFPEMQRKPLINSSTT